MIRPASVSVIIRNRNESRYLKRVLQALSQQELKPVDIVLVDNESADDSVAVGLKFGAKIVPIDQSSFTYGRALNIGIREAVGEVCVILSAHSLPIGTSFLTECVKPFADERVAAVRCLYAGKGADQERWLSPELLRDPTDIRTVISKGPLASGCAIRKKVWEEIPFNEEVAAAEEKLWALDVLRKGHLIYSPCSALYQYIKKSSPAGDVIKNSREIVAIYRLTGIRLGFANRGAFYGLLDIFKAIFYSAPANAASVILKESLKTYFRFSLPFQANRKPKSGSII